MTIKAVGLLSGGLDSTLAAKMMMDQGIEVHAMNFTSPFCNCTPKSAGCAAVITAVKQLGDIPLKRDVLGEEFLYTVAKPKHGHGAGLNPCIDCRTMKIRKAGEYMDSVGGKFLFTGEVLGQRPMSQHKRAIKLIDEDSGYGDVTLRPLSAKHFEPTLPEREGWVDREKLLDMSGRTRKPQIKMAEESGINDYPCPAGGCKLTEKPFAEKLQDYFDHNKKYKLEDMPLLKIGRHFRLESGEKVIVSRNQAEGNMFEKLAKHEHHLLIPNFSGPSVIIDGDNLDAGIEKIKEYTNKDISGEAIVEHRFQGNVSILQIS